MCFSKTQLHHPRLDFNLSYIISTTHNSTCITLVYLWISIDHLKCVQISTNPTRTIQMFCSTIENCTCNHLWSDTRRIETVLFGWKRTHEGCVKLNCDGRAKEMRIVQVWWTSLGYWWKMYQRFCVKDWQLWCPSCKNVGFVLGSWATLAWWNFTYLHKMWL